MNVKILLFILIVLLFIFLLYILNKKKNYEYYDGSNIITDLKNMLKEYKTYVIMGIQSAKKISNEKATAVFNDLLLADNPAKYFQENIPEININSLPSSFNELKEKFNKAINL